MINYPINQCVSMYIKLDSNTTGASGWTFHEMVDPISVVFDFDIFHLKSASLILQHVKYMFVTICKKNLNLIL